MEAQVQEMASQVTNNVYVINEVLLAQQSIKDLLTSLLPPHASTLRPLGTAAFNSPPTRTNTPVPTRTQVYSNGYGIAVAGGVPPCSPRDHQSHLPSPPSWMTADTVPVSTSNQGVQEAVPECMNASHELSQTVLVGSDGQTPTETDPRSPCAESAHTTTFTTSPVVDNRVSTRSRGAVGDYIPVEGTTDGGERTKCAPKEKAEAVACMRLCWILHPDAGDDIVAEGRAGGSWKSPTQKFGNLCSFGDQMVQVHKVFFGNYRLLHLEERNPSFSTLEHAVVKSKYSNVYIKWDSRFLIAKPTK